MHVSDLNAAWLDDVLGTGTSVTDIEISRIGTGQVADSHQVVLRSERGDDLFTSMVTNAVRHARGRGGFAELGIATETVDA